MQRIIFAFVTVISLQTIHAFSQINRCENDLANLKKDSAKFFVDFKTEHDVAHNAFIQIKFAVQMLGSSFDQFLSIKYGEDFPLDTLQCILKQFVDSLTKQHAETDKNIVHLQDEIDVLLNMASKFSRKQNLICRKGKFIGCEGSLNQLRCELSDFFIVLKKAARQAGNDLWHIEDASSDLTRIEQKFKSKYTLTCGQTAGETQPQKTCGCGKANINNLKHDIKIFYKEFRQPYDANINKVKDLSNICDNLSAEILSWNNKLA
ncbi:hypothetical protein Bhyg_14770 [Pseudolycoriella hygida]|uniref:Uncharacterized protein n=1 Tax=Pseudolycoriella hygida TaxID=35572 RepID=A0A9Q0MQL5_9DIPT|nr:hypothetical protein Bhyg_14770 [Pseudolycoriella hygida]